MADSKLQIVITARDEAGKVLKGISSDLKSVSNTMSTIGSGMTFGITAPIMGLGAAISKMAMDAVESENLFDVSMKGMAASARQWSNDIGKALGLNAYEVRRNVGVFNSMFTAMGLGDKASLDMSESLTQLAYDMASFYNLNPALAFEKLRAGIMGETEPLRQLGVVVNETTAKTWALNNGLIQQGQELSEGQKILARYGLIMQQTSNAQGDLARTADSPANALRRMRSQFEEIAISAGQVFLPEVSKALGWINNEGIPRVRAALDEFKSSWASMSDEGKQQIMGLAALLVGGGPLLMGLSMAYRAVVALIAAFKTLRMGALVEIMAISAALFQIPYQIERIREGKGVNFGEGLRQFAESAGGLFDEVVKTTGGVMTLDAAMMGLGLDGVAVFDDIAKAASKVVVAMPAQEDLEAAMATGPRVNVAGPFSQADLIKNYEEVNNVIIRTSATLQAQTPALQTAQGEWDKLGAAGSKAGQDIAASARGMIAPTTQIVDYMVRMHPAAIAAAAAVSTLKASIAGVQAAIAANNDAIHEAQAVLSGLQEQVSRLSESLSNAKSRLEDLANVRLTGMNDLDEQMFQIEQHIKRLKLEQMGVDASMFAPLSAGAAAFVATLPQSVEELEKLLEVMRLQRSLRYDEQLKRIGEAAHGLPREMNFADALSQITATKNEIVGLEGALAGAQGAVKAQQAVIAALQEAGYQLNKQLQELQTELQGAEDKQAAVTEVLKTAAEWEIEHKEKLKELGGEYALQAGVIDEMTRQLVTDMTAFVKEETATATQAIRDMYQEYMDKKALMAGGGGGSPAPAPTPEPPTTAPSGSSTGEGGSTASNQTVYITVQGSVVTERELADLVRNQLIKTGKRNVNVGLS